MSTRRERLERDQRLESEARDLAELRTYALAGLRTKLEELLASTTHLSRLFPDLSSPLGGVRTALKAVMERAGGGDFAGANDEDKYAPNGVKPKPKRGRPVGSKNKNKPKPPTTKPTTTPKPKPKPTTTRRPEHTEKIAEQTAARAWEVGKEVLSPLARAPDGMTVGDLARGMGTTYGAAGWRLRQRRRKGHVKKDAATGLWMITQDGRAALAVDRDNDDKDTR